MKKLAILGAALLAAAVTASTALAVHSPPSAKPTQCTRGALIVNVTYSLYNDADSGFYGNWAIDNLNRHMQIFDLGGGVYCETLNDTGSFVTTGPLSPENGVALSAGIKGQINGGYVTTNFTGVLNPSPAYAMKGNLGPFDANAAHPSFESYFSSYAGWDQPSWGWSYHTAQNGNWVNASTGSFGDITGS